MSHTYHISLSQTSWNESDSSRRLTERVWDITRWRDTLEASAQELDREMDALTLVNPTN